LEELYRYSSFNRTLMGYSSSPTLKSETSRAKEGGSEGIGHHEGGQAVSHELVPVEAHQHFRLANVQIHAEAFDSLYVGFIDEPAGWNR
jgi:hypothetical protein